MILEGSEFANVKILYSDCGGGVLQTERGHVVTVQDEDGGVYIPPKIVRKYGTRLFRIHEKQGEIILTPTKVQLEVVEEEGAILETPNEEKNCGERNAETTHK